MKKNWTKLLIVLLTLTMVLSLAACGGKPEETTKAPETSKAPGTPEATPDESTPEATPEATTPEATPEASTPQATPEASTPQATPEASTPQATPEASTPQATPEASTPQATPEASQPAASNRPTVPTFESYTKDEGEDNWVYEIDKTDVAIAVDGVIEEEAYFTEGNAIYLVSEIRPAASGSKFDVFMTADETHIYVFYEFTKMEEIFWDPDYGSKYHLDCVDFCLNIAGLKSVGTEFRIYAGVEGGMDAEGYVNGGAKSAGVDALYVKHTETGYNVEFSIPLEKVSGMDANGDKMISFTALSTITTAWEDKTAAPTRVYTVACKAAGAEAKDSPSYLVVKGTAPEDVPNITITDDGRWLITVEAATSILADADAVKAQAEAKENVYVGEYADGPTENLNETNNYKAYVAADAETLYVFFDINDSNIVAHTETSWWQNDCAEVDIDIAGGKIENETTVALRVWPAAEGTNHYAADDEYGLWHGNGAGVGSLTSAIENGILESYTVAFKEGGYTVLYKFNRSAIKDGNVAAMYFSVALNDRTGGTDDAPEYNRAYVAIDSVAHAAGNSAKPFANVFQIVDAPREVTAPVGQTAKGNDVYEVTKSEAALVVDGVMDAAYDNGVYLTATHNLPASGSTFNIYFSADETHIYVLYEFIKEEDIFWNEEYASRHHLDCADFLLALDAKEGWGAELHIMGGIEGDKNTAKIKNDPAAAGVDNWYVKHTDKGYNVEFSIPLASVTGTDANFDKMISFNAVSTITTDWLDPTGAPTRVYTFVTNGAKTTDCNAPLKENPNLLVIKDTATKTDDGRYTFTLNAAEAALTVDGDMDDAYAAGLKFDAIYNVDEKNGFTAYLAADADYVYVLYVVKDENIINNGPDYSSYWHNDCADFIINYDATANGGKEFRIFGNIEGDKTTANAAGVPAEVTAFFVKTTEAGYNVEFAIDRAAFADKNVFTFLAMSTNASAADARVYSCINTSAGEGGNPAKAALNEVKIVDVVAPIERPTEMTANTGVTAAGNWIYEIEAGADVEVDGTLDEAYFTGIFLEPDRNLPTAKGDAYLDSVATFDVFLYVGETHLYVFYEFVKDNGEIIWDADYGSKYHLDCVDFVINYTGAEANGNEFRIMGGIEGDINTAFNMDAAANVDALYVKHTEAGYNVEFSIALDKITGDTEGNKTFSFTALSTIALVRDGGDGKPVRAYTCAAKASTATGEDKANPSIVVIK